MTQAFTIQTATGEIIASYGDDAGDDAVSATRRLATERNETLYLCGGRADAVEVDPRRAAVARHEGCDLDEVGDVDDGDLYSVGGREYRVLTDDEANAAARIQILDSVWAFRPSFLASHCVKGVDARTIELIQANNRCDDNNVVLTRLIVDVDRFVEDAISSDGRGRFLSSYDSEEHQIGALFVYSTN